MKLHKAYSHKTHDLLLLDGWCLTTSPTSNGHIEVILLLELIVKSKINIEVSGGAANSTMVRAADL